MSEKYPLPPRLQKQVDDFKAMCDEMWRRLAEQDQFRRDVAWARRTAGFNVKHAVSEVCSGDPADEDTEKDYSTIKPQSGTFGRL